ncbi:hypothetical protein SGLAM104S_02603 [Streptomyces glaucescens]
MILSGDLTEALSAPFGQGYTRPVSALPRAMSSSSPGMAVAEPVESWISCHGTSSSVPRIAG